MRRMILFVPLLLSSCGKPSEPPAQVPVVTYVPDTTMTLDGKNVVVPAGKALRYSVVTETETPGTKTTTSSKGPSISTDSASVAQALKVGTTSAGLKGAGGGGFEYSGTLTGGKTFNLFHFLGAACVIGAGLMFWLTRDVFRSLILFGTGMALVAIGISVEYYPQIWLAGLGLLLILGGVWVYDAWKKGNLGVTLQKVTRGISEAPDEAKAAVKASIAETTESDPKLKKVVDGTIAAAKLKEGV